MMTGDRRLKMNGAQATAFWTRIQKARHQQGVAHYRRLIEPDTNRVCVDLGECECPKP
jgi:hypothetical protein